MPSFDKETVCQCALNSALGYKPAIANALVEELGCASAVYEMSGKDLKEMFGPYAGISDTLTPGYLEKARKDLETAHDDGYRFVTQQDAGYPSLLKECRDRPLGLFIKSSGQDLPRGRMPTFVSVVGTRDLSPYGREWCRKIIECLSCSDLNPVIVSGLAYGTDFTAHTSALEHGLGTVAVMATGPGRIYPAFHKGIAERISSSGGSALMTDFPPGTEPKPFNFIRRNRIIAGMSAATILIESRIKGGGLVTARQAFSYDRDIFALPGRVDDCRSGGCNTLIKEGIASPLLDPGDLVSFLGGKLMTGSGKICRDVPAYGRTGRMADIILTVKNRRGITADEIADSLNIPYNETAKLVDLLENDGIITRDLMRRCFINTKKI